MFIIYACRQQTVKKLRFSKAPVEAITKFIKIFLEIFRRNPMKGTIDKRLHISYHDVNQRKPFRCLFRGSYFLLARVAFSNSVQCRKSLCANILTCFQMEHKKITNCLFGYCFNSLHSYKTSTLGTMLHSYKNRFFPFSPPVSLASTLSTELSIINSISF